MMNQDRILKKIQDFFMERGVEITNEKLLNVNFIDDGYLDSFGILNFLVFLSDEFNFRLNPDDFSNENNKYIKTIIDLIIKS